MSLASPLRMGSTGRWAGSMLLQRNCYIFLELITLSRIIVFVEANDFASPHLHEIQHHGRNVGFTVTIQTSQQTYGVAMFINKEVSTKKSPCAARWRPVIGIRREFRVWLNIAACGMTQECADAYQVIWDSAWPSEHPEELKWRLKAGDTLNLSNADCFSLRHTKDGF